MGFEMWLLAPVKGNGSFWQSDTHSMGSWGILWEFLSLPQQSFRNPAWAVSQDRCDLSSVFSPLVLFPSSGFAFWLPQDAQLPFLPRTYTMKYCLYLQLSWTVHLRRFNLATPCIHHMSAVFSSRNPSTLSPTKWQAFASSCFRGIDLWNRPGKFHFLATFLL